MDGLGERGQVIVIGATNRETALDPALRRPGRFDREIEIGIPTLKGRREILQIHTRGMPLSDDVDIGHLSAITQGFVGADIASLAREAAMKCLGRYLPEFDLDRPVPSSILADMRVTSDDFKEALRDVEPSAMREVSVEIPEVSWDDIGGLEKVKETLKELIELPLQNPDCYKNVGITPARGVLLYGPPGTGKTLIAKAVANECKVNFLSIKGPEIMSKWMGDSEKAVRQIFKKAKQIAPSIIFLDEIDAIAPKRGHLNDSGTTERVVNQLLTSMDGFEDMEKVMVVGATNRPDIIDPALLRPGRFDSLTLVPLPDIKDREAIIRVNTKNMQLDNVDFKLLAAKTEWFSGADITALCRESGLNAIRNGRSVVVQSDFEKALKNVYPSCDKSIIKWYEDFSKKIERISPEWKDAGAYR